MKLINIFLLAVCSLTSLGNMMAQDMKTLFDFSHTDSASDWTIVNDGVMGGISKSQFKVNEDETAAFNGVVSLKNYGGFASVRSASREYALGNYSGIILRVNGDGNKYKFRIRTDSNFDGVVYSADFETLENKWLEIKIPFSSFSPQFRGRILKDVTALDAAKIKQIGILVSDKQEGEFNLVIDWIKAY